MSSAKLDQVVAKYVELRDARELLKKKYEAKDAELVEKLDKLEQVLTGICEKLGVESLKTSAGTAMRSVSTRYWTSDWEAFHKLVVEHNVPQLLERRIAQKSLKEFIEQHPDLTPAGLNSDSKYKITVRRAKASAESD